MKHFREKIIPGHFPLILRLSLVLPRWPPGVRINNSLFFSPITSFLATFEEKGEWPLLRIPMCILAFFA